MATEIVASFGSTILVLAVFGLLFRTGLERLLRQAEGRLRDPQSASKTFCKVPTHKASRLKNPGLRPSLTASE